MEKVILSVSGEKYAQIKHCSQVKTVLSVDFNVRGQQGMYLFTGLNVIMHYELGQKWPFKAKTSWWICFLQTHSFSLHKMFTDGLESCGSLYCDYCDVFISCFDSHSDGTHSLQRIHWWASDGKPNLSKSVLMKNKLGWPEGELKFSKFSSLFL